MAYTDRPSTPAQQEWFVRGYQECLVDIANALVDKGAGGVEEWVRNNAQRAFAEDMSPEVALTFGLRTT